MEDRDRDHRGGADEDAPGPAAAAVAAVDGEDEVEDDGGGFSFPVPPFAADAFIVPVYPVFGRPMSPPPREAVVEELSPVLNSILSSSLSPSSCSSSPVHIARYSQYNS
ncbi:Os01g0661600 [Oryza sativa Japonica Group]|uniref:Os01g0661600 protein n=1 Tax=Oryza sativa subsp. japonica TaxID=39947 RepID=Q0JKN4_ORYSJ|nr:Os01g0661600 [Oryza sativa Japonica Group]|eukprot:NP_001043780.2 Os01g0661600 [Oryza sativa Japonica Group]